ncbi:MAG TPA: hypothetical protein VFH78_04315 [Candidatus Thermoplasmatota archaeon]|nr:hypothetical protein [Candidatus Thermoplasmatota archaeon]
MRHARTILTLLLAASFAAAALPTAFGLVSEDTVTPDEVSDRFVPRLPGVQRDMTFFYGPFTIPPGQDINRVTLDVPVQGGFLVDVQANIYDVLTGDRPSNQMMHIHHAHWFRVSEDPNDEYYVSGGDLFGIAWVFGTGEERTKGDIDVRSAENGPGGPRYGVYIEPGKPQALIYMLHNKNAVAQTVYVALDVSFVYGSAEQIRDAPADCGPLPLQEGERCRAGENFHHLHGTLWGNTWDVPRNFTAAQLGVESVHVRGPKDAPSLMFTVAADGLGIGTAGHLHPNGIDVIIANLGPAGSGCERDVDGDGWPGVTLAVSHKFAQIPGVVSSEEYQMGVTQDGWRAPVRAGDRIAQYGTYFDHEYASYEAMSYAGFYVDRQAPPAPFAADCSTPAGAAAFFEKARAYLIDDGVVQPFTTTEDYFATVTRTKLNDDWEGRVNHGHCGLAHDDPSSERDDRLPCDDATKPVPPVGSGQAVAAVHIADFLYLPGDHSLSGDLGTPPRVTKGEPLRFVNEDVAIGVRHSVTSCKFPCNGQYVANYPNPDGWFDSGKMGNLDYIDGGLAQTGGQHHLAHLVHYSGPGLSNDAYPYWDLDTSELEPGMYSYYCRIHPWMRGWVEVAAP